MKRTTHVTEGERPVEDVFALLTGEGWAEQVRAALHDDCTLVSREVGPDGAVTVVKSRRTEPLPGFVAKLAPSEVRIVTTDVWGPLDDGVRSCTWTAEIPGAPVRIRGTQRLEPAPQGSRHTVDAEVTVSVPLVGGKIESFIVEQVQRIADAEEHVVRAALA